MNPGRPHRKALRLPSFDYAAAGAYFVTICCHDRELFLADEQTRIAIQAAWDAIPLHFERAKLDEFVIMPNHVHGIIWLVDIPNVAESPAVGAQHAEPLRPGVRPGSLSALVRSFKSAATSEARRRGFDPNLPFWQRNFYEHVIRNDDELDRIRQYIRLNPLRWLLDTENPDRRLDEAYEQDWGWLEASAPAKHPL